ncbi:MAG TPA: Mu-like prophage major head subunit gpT family protein [Phycisphaerae bacterium]|nr:Mu-like prophage major head subunit gpT family protein [Phycisphaerae bacterium]
MTVVNPVILEKGLKTAFMTAYEAAAAIWSQIATPVPSTTSQEKYGWLGQSPAMREWTDERIPKGLADHDYTIVNRDWEASIAVHRNALEDDQLGAIPMRVRDLAERAKTHPDELILDLLVEGDTNLCYDGKAFFAATHVDPGAEYSTAQDNQIGYACVDGTAPTLAETKAAFQQARETLLGFKDDRGKPAHTSAAGLAVVCNQHLQVVFEELLNATLISNTTNVLKGAASLIVSPLYSETARFVLLKADRALKPLILQQRQNARLATTQSLSQSNPNEFQRMGVAEFLRKNIFFGVDARYNAGYGDWRTAVETTLTTA